MGMKKLICNFQWKRNIKRYVRKVNDYHLFGKVNIDCWYARWDVVVHVSEFKEDIRKSTLLILLIKRKALIIAFIMLICLWSYASHFVPLL